MKKDDQRHAAFIAYRAELVSYAANILGSRHDAEDVIQEAFLRYVPDSAIAPTSPRAYLYRIVRNIAFDLKKRRKIENRDHPDDTPWWGLPQSHGTPEERTLMCDRVRQMEKILSAMPAQQRIALEMHRFGGYRVEDIAKHIGVSVPTTYRLLQAAVLEMERGLL